MQISKSMPREEQVAIIRAALKKEADARPEFWQRKCEGVHCGRTQSHVAVSDEYFATPFEAHQQGIRFHIFLCKRCANDAMWEGVEILLRRKNVSLSKKRKCTTAEVDCARKATVFFYTGYETKQGAEEKRWFCVNHGAIHSVSVYMYRLNTGGKEVDITEALEAFYEEHVRPGIVRVQYKGE